MVSSQLTEGPYFTRLALEARDDPARPAEKRPSSKRKEGSMAVAVALAAAKRSGQASG